MRVVDAAVIMAVLAGGEEAEAPTGKDGTCLLQFRGFKSKLQSPGRDDVVEVHGAGEVHRERPAVVPELAGHARPVETLLQFVKQNPANSTNSTDVLYAVSPLTSTSVMVGVVGLGLALAAWFRADLFETQEQEEEGAPKKDRSMLLDHCKLLGSFLVIYGHFLYYNMTGEFHETQTWLYGADAWIKSTVDARAMIMMPMICFVSGVCSQGPVTAKRMRRFLQNLVVPTIIWTCFAKPMIFDTLLDFSMTTLEERWNQLITLQAFHEEWYLQALVLWRGSAFLLWSHMRPSVAFALMVSVSLLGGYHHYDQASAGWMKFDEALGFLPYFALGYAIPFKKVEQAVAPASTPAPLMMILLWVFAAAPALFDLDPLPDGHGWYGCCGAGKEFTRIVDSGLVAEYQLYFMRRLAKITIDVVPMLMLVFLVIPRTVTPISWVGSQTLHPYLFHLVLLTWLDRAWAYVPLPVVEGNFGHLFVLALHIPIALGIQYILASPTFRWLWSWCFEPAWLLDPILAPMQEEAEKSAPAKVEQRDAVDDRETASGTESDANQSTPRGMRTVFSASDMSIAESDMSLNELPDWSRGSCRWKPGRDIIGMKEAREFYPYLLPIFLVALALPLILLAIIGPQLIIRVLTKIPFSLGAFVLVVINAPLVAQFGYHVYRLWGTDKPPPMTQLAGAALTHVVVVVEYKEPVDVLGRTVETIAQQTGVAVRPMVVLATEARDEERHATAAALKEQCGSRISRFLMTEHNLTEGETVGKHSNENVAVREVYRQLVEEEGMDPFEIMITVVDADSLLSTSYLAHVEAAFKKQQDGRRLVYSGPLNTYRNFADAGLLVQMYEIMRCNTDTFHDPLKCYYPQSNYSLSLGFIAELGYWSIDTMPEDVHTAAKAMINNFGALSTVPVPALICNDMVENYGDRYTQAKRHQWGITEMAWHFALAKHMNLTFPGWWAVFAAENRRAGSFFSCAQIFCSFLIFPLAIVYACFNWSALDWKIQTYVYLALAGMVIQWTVFWCQELFLWRHLLHQFPIENASTLRWVLLVALSPVWHALATLAFFVVPTIHCLYHVTFVGELGYVCAPKGEAQKTEGAEAKVETKDA